MTEIYKHKLAEMVLAEKAKGPNAKERIQVLLMNASPAGFTSEEMERMLSMPHQTVSARVSELAKGGAIKDSGDRRLTRWGKSAVVYVINEEAR